jgi:membrane associated rhomboid family serine protease
MFFPISDDDKDVSTIAYVTYVLMAANILMFIYQTSNPDFTYGWSVIPREITSGEDLVLPQPIEVPGQGIVEIPQAPGPPIIWLTLLTSMFMHGGVGHIAGNMLYLWIFGNNVEHRFGHVLFLAFYLLSGVVGSVAQIAVDPQGVLPNLGASGAIAGVMGAYLVLFPYNKVNAVFFVTVVSVPAIFVLGMWGAMQLVSGFGSIASTSQSTGGVAYMAHVGGFVSGLVVAVLLRGKMKEEPDSELRRNYQRDPTARRIW